MLSLNDPYEIQIDREGIWYFRGTEMIRQDIVQYFYQHLKSDNAGTFYIEIEDEQCRVGVEDVPYVIKSVDLVHSQKDETACLVISLTDGNTEMLNLDKPMRIGKDNVLYCRVRKGKFEARFSRPAYYQLCGYIEYDPIKQVYALNFNHSSIPICFY
jgi:hypothetical protein